MSSHSAVPTSIVISLLLMVPACARTSRQAPPVHATLEPAPAVSPEARPVVPARGDDDLGASALLPAFFDYDSYALRDDARTVLDRNARYLRERPELEVIIEGHCDERGSLEYNQALGDRRARAARDYLVAAGCASGRLTTISYGEERPFDEAHNEEAWSQNRRAHLVPQPIPN